MSRGGFSIRERNVVVTFVRGASYPNMLEKPPCDYLCTDEKNALM